MPRCCVTADSSAALVPADVLARHHRLRGDRVWFAACHPELRDGLALSSTAVLPEVDDEAHRAGAERIGRACAEAGDLVDGVFRLSRFAGPLAGLIDSGRLRVSAEVDPAGLRDVRLSPGLAELRPVTGFGARYRRWWLEADRRVHVTDGDPLLLEALLLSAGLPPPTDVVRVDARADLVGGPDGARWWLLGDVRRKDLGALVDRVTVMVHRYRDGRPPAPAEVPGLTDACREAPGLVDRALAEFDLVGAGGAVWRIVERAAEFLDGARPWELARSTEQDGRRLDVVLGAVLSACRALSVQLTPFLPAAAARITTQCVTLTERLPPPRALFPQG
ncbi:hypothetical protein [Actinosynnema sp. NPDC020468]|uniref:hypothetical protein n=1 Tax=Actinosynnema sp. NPDC020468 TaxID=3154488 RepID=UPI0033DE108A